ncbi:hypothetical protein, variant 3 [Aphanomyces invadans]|uniref:UBX domain-containing protein n=1 Tax=Aphanomyces invadans TaxID=157072 RepID=A0A024U2C4_9STRA|nr:hypothetical protein, variant 3 [Aphanomyces invadans]ETW00384.1 hypothetical protein, variant 3 [Aphanomyces invadans]|eukprot:XP_008870519.1 hypothetical protein, variant 3 [Aphanomyces invadans]
MSVVVLYDGRRKKIAVTAGTYMSDVLKKACDGFGLDNNDGFQLHHKDKNVDLSIPFRLSGVSVNAVLEVKERCKSALSDVRVAIQLADGRRVHGSFSPQMTVADILVQLAVPVDVSLNYMRRDLSPDELSSVTLQQLGLLSGSVIFRVKVDALAIPVAQAVSPASSAAQSANTIAQAGPIARPLSQETAVADTVVPQASTYETTEDVEMDLSRQEVSTSIAPTEATVKSLSSYDALQLVRNSCFDAVSTTVVTTLMRIVCNVLSKPEEPRVRSIRAGNPKFHDAIGKHNGGVLFLASIGFSLNDEGYYVLPSDADASLLHRALEELHEQADDLRIPPGERPAVVVQAAAPVEFDAYKAVITRVQAQPRGMSITEMRLEDLKRKEEAILAVKIPSRKPRLLAQAMRARQDEAEKNQNFRTSAMRELDELQKKTVFQSTVLRVRMPDQVTVQATFHPHETMEAVAQLLQEYFFKDGHSFSLYVTPPRQTLALDGAATLAQLNLVPAALVYVQWKTPALSRADIGYYLRASVVDELCEETKDDDVDR